MSTGLNLSLMFDVIWNIQKSNFDSDDEIIARNFCYFNRSYLHLLSTLVVSDIFPLLIVNGMLNRFKIRFIPRRLLVYVNFNKRSPYKIHS